MEAKLKFTAVATGRGKPIPSVSGLGREEGPSLRQEEGCPDGEAALMGCYLLP